jgi:hypothetical protein
MPVLYSNLNLFYNYLKKIHFRYTRIPCQPSHTYAVLPRAVLISTFPPFLISVHTKNWWHSDEGIHICRRQGCNAAWNQFSSLQIKKSCGHIFDTFFYYFVLPLSALMCSLLWKNWTLRFWWVTSSHDFSNLRFPQMLVISHLSVWIKIQERSWPWIAVIIFKEFTVSWNILWDCFGIKYQVQHGKLLCYFSGLST